MKRLLRILRGDPCGLEWHGDIWGDGQKGAFDQIFVHRCDKSAGHRSIHRCSACGLTPGTSWAKPRV